MKLFALVVLVVVGLAVGKVVTGQNPPSNAKALADPSPTVSHGSPTPSTAQLQASKAPRTTIKPHSAPRSAPLAQTDCTHGVVNTFTAFPGPGANQVRLTWKVTGACQPATGWIAGGYNAGGAILNWTIYIKGASGSYVDTVQRKSSSGPCYVNAYYSMWVSGMSSSSGFVTVNNVYVCPT